MANDMKRVYGTNNAFEFSNLYTSSGTQQVIGESLFIPSNVASLVLSLKRKSGLGKYKLQVTTSTRNEIFGLNGEGPAEWFDWDIPNLDASGFYDQDELQWWVPIQSGIRIVLEDVASTEVYFSIRAN